MTLVNSTHHPPTFDDVVAASDRLLGHAHRTPVMTSRMADEQFGADVFSSVKTCNARALSSFAARSMRFQNVTTSSAVLAW